jgi:hypothetical protein
LIADGGLVLDNQDKRVLGFHEWISMLNRKE